MPKETCLRCGNSKLIPSQNHDNPDDWMCSACEIKLQRRINQIDREADEEVKAGKLKVLFRNIPAETVPGEMQQMVEEVSDPEFLPEARIHKAGMLNEMNNNTKKGLELKPRYKPK